MEAFEWGWLIVVYLFLGGVGAGAYFVSGLATYLGNQDAYRTISRWGAYLAPWPIMIGSEDQACTPPPSRKSLAA